MMNTLPPRGGDPLAVTRRHFLSGAGLGLGGLALGTLLPRELRAAPGGVLGAPHFPPKAKRVIYLFQSGAPSQMDLFDHKPLLGDLRATELPDSIRRGEPLATFNVKHYSTIPGLVTIQPY